MIHRRIEHQYAIEPFGQQRPQRWISDSIERDAGISERLRDVPVA